MREYLFQGKSVWTDKWVCGSLIHIGDYCCIIDENAHDLDIPYMNGGTGCIDGYAIPVVPESVGQYTGMKEFVAFDESFNRPLFEGDIVEVWSNRSPKYTRVAKSQYDGDVVVRAIICFKRGSWTLDYDNKYNEAIAKLRGKEADERAVDGDWDLYHYGPRYSQEEWLREHNFKWRDIKKIGTVFENADLLESD